MEDFIRAHMAVLVATDFFIVEVLTLTGLITYDVLFFIHLESPRICLAGMTRHPDQEGMEQMARNATMGEGSLRRALRHYEAHYHQERNHQGKDNVLLFPLPTPSIRKQDKVRCRERLGGLLKYYERKAA